jgi:hypothetical protein
LGSHCKRPVGILTTERKAGVFVMLRDGYSVDPIISCSDIPSTSNIRTYIDRINDRKQEAESSLKTAEQTIDVLDNFETPPSI